MAGCATTRTTGSGSGSRERGQNAYIITRHVSAASDVCEHGDIDPNAFRLVNTFFFCGQPQRRVVMFDAPNKSVAVSAHVNESTQAALMVRRL